VRRLQRLRSGQYHVGVPRGLVHVDVHREHEVEALDCLLQPLGVRCGDHRVAGDGDEGSDLSFPRSVDLLGKAGHGQLPVALRQPANATMPASEPHALAGSGGVRGVLLAGCREREHHAALAVEVAGEYVEHITSQLASVPNSWVQVPMRA
jgi:hypothetical protein